MTRSDRFSRGADEHAFRARAHSTEGPMGFNELGRAVGGCNPATLKLRLDHLEKLGLLVRTVRSYMPPRTSYQRTRRRGPAARVIMAIDGWGASTFRPPQRLAEPGLVITLETGSHCTFVEVLAAPWPTDRGREMSLSVLAAQGREAYRSPTDAVGAAPGPVSVTGNARRSCALGG